MDFLRMLSEIRQPFWDTLFQYITIMAQEVFVIVVLCWFYWCHDKILAYSLGFTYFLSGLLVQGLKLTFRIPRPWILDPDFEPVASAVPAATGYSFPSGHTQSGTALFSTLGFNSKHKIWKCICFFFMLMIGFSRMYLGVHTPKDVLTALILTFVISYVIHKYLKKDLEKPEKAKFFGLLLFIICVLMFVYTCFFYFTQTEDQYMAKSAFKACGAGFGFALGYYLERTKIQFTPPTTIKEKVLRFVIGLVSVVILMLFFELTLDKFLVRKIISYFILVLWIVAIYPAIFTRWKK